jgi:hypothetical protein
MASVHLTKYFVLLGFLLGFLMPATKSQGFVQLYMYCYALFPFCAGTLKDLDSIVICAGCEFHDHFDGLLSDERPHQSDQKQVITT